MTGGKPRVLSRQCATCILRPGDPMHLGAERTRTIIRANLDAGALLTCHDTLSYGSHPDAGEAACRGFLDAYGDRVNVVRVMQRIAAITGDDSWYEEVDPPGE